MLLKRGDGDVMMPETRDKGNFFPFGLDLVTKVVTKKILQAQGRKG